jgi:hypothetical protein
MGWLRSSVHQGKLSPGALHLDVVRYFEDVTHRFAHLRTLHVMSHRFHLPMGRPLQSSTGLPRVFAALLRERSAL